MRRSRSLGIGLLAGLMMALPLAVRAIPAELPLRALAYQSWSLEAGLPQRSVQALAFDREGFAWIGTQNGLARFDGSQFQVFSVQDTPALKSSFITRLHFDRRGRLWIGTAKGLAVYQDGRFSGLLAEGQELGRINGLAEDAGGDLYAASDKGLYRVQAERVQALPGWSGPGTAALTGPDAVWVAGTGRIARFRGGVQKDLSLAPRFTDAVVSTMTWADGGLWLASTRGLLRLEGERFEPVMLEPGAESPQIESLAPDGTTGLWAGTDKLLYRLERGRVVSRTATQAPGVLPWPRTIIASPGDLWLGSRTDGLQHFWDSGNRRIGTEDGLSDSVVWSYAVDGPRLLVGTNAGVSVIENGKARTYIPAEALPYPVAYSLLRDAGGNLWVGTYAGLARFKPNGLIDRRLPEFDSIQINGLGQDAAGIVWAATTRGLFRIDGDRVELIEPSTGLPTKGIRYVLHGRRGDFWVGTEDGLFQQQGERFTPVSAPGLDGAFVTSLLELENGRLVVGTLDRGLFLSGPQGWRNWSKEQGLPSASAYFLAARGSWLIAAGAGAYRLPLATLDLPAGQALPVEVLVGNPGEHQGGVRIRCCGGAGNSKGVLIDNAVWLPTTEGAMRVRVDGPSPVPPSAHLVKIEHARKTQPPAASLVLGGPMRDAAIQYGAIDYKQTSPLQFRYRLQGFDSDWIDARDRRTAFYTNLPPGRFAFEVQARRAFEAWGPTASITLEVPPVFSETWWFRLLCGLAALALIAALVQWRLRQLQAQKLALEAIVAERTRELEKANRDLREMSVTDSLTGLHNRRYLEQEIPKLAAKLARRRADSGRDLVIGVLVIDIDYFKKINDRFGHAGGDLVLQRAAEALRAAVRDGEVVLRWGGEEFLAVIDGTERDSLASIAQRLHQAIAESCTELELAPGDVLAGITCSIGYAALPITADASELIWEDALQLADYALYAAKNAGRDRCMTVDPNQVLPGRWHNKGG